MKKWAGRITPIITVVVLILSILTFLFFAGGGITGFTSVRSSEVECTFNSECLSQLCSNGSCTCETNEDCREGTCVDLRCVL